MFCIKSPPTVSRTSVFGSRTALTFRHCSANPRREDHFCGPAAGTLHTINCLLPAGFLAPRKNSPVIFQNRADNPGSKKDTISTRGYWVRSISQFMPITFIVNRLKNQRTCKCHSQESSSREAMLLSSNDGKENTQLKNITKDVLHSELSSKVSTLPTILTLGRVVAIPVLVFAFYSSEWWATAAVASIFMLALITDWLDGFLARKMRSYSTFGAFLDPVADKLMVATALVLLCSKPLDVPWAASYPWLISLPSAAIIGREITISAVREWAATRGEKLQAAVAVNKLGKWKTATQMVALTVLLATRVSSQDGCVHQLVSMGICLLYVSAGLALWSLVVYMKGIWGDLIK